MDYKTIYTSDSNEFLTKFGEYEFDIIFADPPYALGSEVIIRKDGKVDYAKASDFMNKWEMPTGEYWEKWFINAYRTLKYGGWLIMYGMDRQTLLFKYYASLAGFDEQQSLYWYFISNFPKATDLSKMIDKNAGVEREVIGTKQYKGTNGDEVYGDYKTGEQPITSAKTELAKKYDGYKYSVAPLKQTCETIMVFKKPTKTGSVLHDTLAFENGDTTITVSALNIDGNRVGTSGGTKKLIENMKDDNIIYGKGLSGGKLEELNDGRYPAQTYIDNGIANALDLQSGISGGGEIKLNSEIKRSGMKNDAPAFNSNNSGIDVNKGQGLGNYGDVGGCSKILHKVQYEKHEHDIFIYEPKVNEGERNNGLDELQEKPRVFNGHSDKPSIDMKDVEKRFTTQPAKNNHPTLKPIDLNAKVLKLFKTPNDQKICFPFAGSGSEILGGLQAGFSQWVACEINQDYVDIANARIKHYTQNEYVQFELF